MTETREYQVLYVEDSPADTEFLQAGFRRVAPEVKFTAVDSGPKAIALLRAAAQGGRLPDIIVLDLKMPGMDGHEVLSSIKASPQWRHIPVMILTSSRLEEDILRAYEIGANCYLPKPDDAIGYTAMANEIHRFWVETALLPPGGSA